ncbi:MAG TPA: cyclic nucleotide-binding domain-containing protein, partial [Tepidisphaeraceae bacterium]|nr:cyclic nucleotide-binding domain-containing protein [Tepidisphaeraceae bacterium]
MDAIQLKKIPLFAQLQDDEAAVLATLLTPRTLKADEVLFWIGDTGHEFYVIQEGRLQITFPDNTVREITLATLNAGDFLGELALMDGEPRSATARAASDAVVLGLGREEFHRFIREHPDAAIHMMKILGRRQRDTVDRLRGIRNVNEVIEERASHWHRIASSITSVAASQFFVLGNVIVIGAWIVINLMLAKAAPDPFPFPFLSLAFSCEAIFLALFILL